MTTAVKKQHVEQIPIDEVETRTLRALKTIRALPDTEQRFFMYKSIWPVFAQNSMDAYNSLEEKPKFRPKPFDVSDCLTALSWTNKLQKPEWRLVWWRSFDVSFKQIAHRIGRSDETARKRYRDAMTEVWYVANFQEDLKKA